MFEKILLPIDQTRESIKTAAKALEIANTHKSRLIVLAVSQPGKPDMNNPDSLPSLVTEVRRQIEQANVQCEVLEREGRPAFVICDIADELNVDVIVMGTRGIQLDKDVESTAVRVIQLAPCPVLVIP